MAIMLLESYVTQIPNSSDSTNTVQERSTGFIVVGGFIFLGSGAQAHRRAVSKQPDGCIGLPNSPAISLPYHIWNNDT